MKVISVLIKNSEQNIKRKYCECLEKLKVTPNTEPKIPKNGLKENTT